MTNSGRTTLDWYIDKIKDTPLLTAQQERELSVRIRKHSDAEAREQMVAANLRLVVKIAKEYTNPGMTLGDLVAEGNLGLMRAVEDFNPEAGVRFSTYAAWWIKQSIRRAMINAGQPIHIPAYLSKLIGKWRRAGKQFQTDYGRAPTTEEMAKKLHVSRKKAEIIREGLRAVSAPSQMGGEGAETMGEMIADSDAASPDHELMQASNLPIVRGLLAKLPQREGQILELRFGLDGWQGPQRTYKEIGAIVGLTRERVRQLEKKALGELRAMQDS